MSLVDSPYTQSIRPNDHLLFNLPCRLTLPIGNQIKAELVLASNKANGLDEGGLIILSHSTRTNAIEILRKLPITTQFTQAILQTPPSPSTSFFHQSSKPHLELKFKNGETDVLHLQIKAQHTAKVHLLLAELRKLTEIARLAGLPRTISHAWMDFYPVENTAMEEDSLNASTSTSAITSPTASTSTLTSPSIASKSETFLSPALDLSNPASNTSIAAEKTSDVISPENDPAYPNPYLPTFSRLDFIRKRLYSNQDDWSSKSSIRVRVTTYNVNDALPTLSSKDLQPLVADNPDLIVLGLQEADLRSSSLLVSAGDIRVDAWEKALFDALGEGDAVEWERLERSQYVGVVLIVLVKKSLAGTIKGKGKSERGIGLMGFGGNKAGVAIRFQLFETTFCFVNSHLAAFAAALDRRRMDFQVLQKGLMFPPSIPVPNAAFQKYVPGPRGFGIEDSEVLVWMGDLNYRINLDDDLVRKMAEEKKWSEMLQSDQLNEDIRSGESFAGFQEGKIEFPPTFKYLHGTTDFDVKRAPAYTDRILFCTPTRSESDVQSASSGSTTSPRIPGEYDSVNASKSSSSAPAATSKITSTGPHPGEALLSPPIHDVAQLVTSNEESQPQIRSPLIQCESYTSHPILYSDHLPVSATLRVQVTVSDEEKKGKVMAGIMNELERLEEVYRPGLEFDETAIDFGEVRYRRPVLREIKMRNNGRVAAPFKFRSPSPNQPFCKPFFWVIPSEGIVESGGEMRLKLVAACDENLAGRLTLGEEEMKDVLVLQVIGGKDTFITLQATPIASMVALPLSLLAQSSKPIRFMTISERKQLAILAQPDPYADTSRRGVKTAKEVWKLLEALMDGGEFGLDNETAEEGRSLDKVLHIIDTLDKDDPVPKYPSIMIFETLLHILAALPTPLLPIHLQAKCLAVSERDDAFGLVEEIGPVERNVLVGVISVIRLCFASLFQAENGVSGDELRSEGILGTKKTYLLDTLSPAVFGPSFSSPETDLAGLNNERRRRRDFVGLLLEG